jgi:hypothetical protein
MPTVVTLGSFSLGTTDPDSVDIQTDGLTSYVSAKEGISIVQGLMGFGSVKFDKRLDESRSRTNLRYPYHVTPYLEAEAADGARYYAGLIYFGNDPHEAKPWELVSAEFGSWKLKHDKLGDWEIEHDALPK